MSSRTLRSRSALAGVLASALAISGCSLTAGSDSDDAGARTSSGGAAPSAQEERESAAVVVSNIRRGAQDVDLTRKLRLSVQDGTFEDVAVTTRRGEPVEGRLSADKTRWVSQELLTSGTRYRVASTAVDADGLPDRRPAK